jgi:FkbM family methyltransferase
MFGESKKFNSYFDQRMIDKLNRLKSEGFVPKTVLDIGAWRGTWARSFTQIFPYSDVILFEANPISLPFLKKSGYKYFNNLLWKYPNVEKQFYTLIDDLSYINTGSSIYIENTDVYNESTTVIKNLKTKTLDNLVSSNSIENINFIKIDVQGSEIDVFEGSKDVFKNNFVEFILMELSIKEYNKGTPDFLEQINYMGSMGFYPFDVFEVHEYEGRTLQIDILFVNKYSDFYKTIKA